jgi:argininosuccinate synthase
VKKPKIVLAFSGGLDTTFCALWLKEELGAEVVTATVDTGGFTKEELAAIKARAKSLGIREHHELDGKSQVFYRFVDPLIQGNILRGRVYPLSVAAERVLQAELVLQLALKLGADGVCHGSTGAGNDQIRFDGVFQALAPKLKVHTPVRDLGWSRAQETEYLAKRGIKIPPKTEAYSVNAGLWGTTVGGGETHDPWVEIPESVYPSADGTNKEPKDIVIGFAKGIPVSLEGKRLAGATLVSQIGEMGRSFGLGRGIHMGDTILGIKGRIGFEAAGPLIDPYRRARRT